MGTLPTLSRLVKLPRLSIVFIIVELKIDQYSYPDKTDNISQIVNISDIDSRISVLKNLKISWPQDEPLLSHLVIELLVCYLCIIDALSSLVIMILGNEHNWEF